MVLRDSCFDGVAHFTAPGTLLVQNKGVLPHSFTAVDGSFDSGLLQPGESAEVVLGEPGIVPVVCNLHGTREGAGMAGILVVGDAGPVGLGEAGVASLVEAHDESTSQALRTQADSVRRIEADVDRLHRTVGSMAAAAGLLAGVLAATALVALRRLRVAQAAGFTETTQRASKPIPTRT
jgi:hypothetical protein